MFVFSQDPQFTHTLTVEVPTDGGHDNQTFRCRYRVIGDTELATFDLNDRQGTVDFLKRAFVGFDDIVDANQQAVPFSDASRDWLIDLAFVRNALAKGYFDAVYKASSGN